MKNSWEEIPLDKSQFVVKRSSCALKENYFSMRKASF